jgi:hypothetical protein
MITAFLNRNLVSDSSENNDMLHCRRIVERFMGDRFQRNNMASPEKSVSGEESLSPTYATGQKIALGH